MSNPDQRAPSYLPSQDDFGPERREWVRVVMVETLLRRGDLSRNSWLDGRNGCDGQASPGSA